MTLFEDACESALCALHCVETTKTQSSCREIRGCCRSCARIGKSLVGGGVNTSDTPSADKCQTQGG